MRCYQLSILSVAAGLLLLAGCNRQQPSPQPAPPAPAPPPTTTTSEQDLLIKSVGKNAQVIHIVKPGSLIVWTGSVPFHIHFVGERDLCEQPSVPNYPGFYAATQTNAATPEYRLQCTLKRDLPPSTAFSYEVIGPLPLNPPSPRFLDRTTPCDGCNNTTPPNSGN